MNTASYSFLKSKTFWSTVVVIGYNFFTVIVPVFPTVPWISTVVDILGFVAVNIFHISGINAAAKSSAAIGQPVSGQ